MAKDHYIIPIFVPHKGCPFDCVFCNQKKITGLNTDVIPEEVDLQIEQYIRTIKDIDKKHVEIAFFGGSFTGIEKQKQEELLTIASKWKKKGIIKDIRLSTRPDYINASIMKFLKKFGVTIVELGVQSMDMQVLEESGRGHTSEHVINAVKIMREFQVKIGLQMMIGLPADNLYKAKDTVDKIIELSPDFVRIYPTLVVRDTYLEKLYAQGKYKPLSLKAGVEISKSLLLKFIKYEIPVIRIGLQPTENIELGREVIAGPYHPSFRQLVESEIFKDMLDYLFSNNKIENTKEIQLQVNDRYISSLVGNKKTNINFIRNKYNIKKVKIFRNNHLESGQMKIVTESGNEISYDMKQYANI